MIELLQVADQVAREKNIDREEVVEAMEQAIQKAGRSKYGHEHDIRATIDRRTGEISLKRMREVAETIENEITQISVEDARHEKPDAAILITQQITSPAFTTLTAFTRAEYDGSQGADARTPDPLK